MIIVRFLAYLVINVVRLFNLVEFYQPTYNPHGYKFIRRNKQKRNSEDRFRAITAAIDVACVHSYLDIGSQFGYYVFKMAELDRRIAAQGIEKDRVSYIYSCATKVLNKVQNASFTRAQMTPMLAEQLSPYDIISFMNVFHHIVHFNGFETADALVRALYRKCNKYFVFESGQFDEKGWYWSEDLSFMGENPVQWIGDYLLQVGFDEVKLLALVETHLSDRKRGLFLCTKNTHPG